MAGVVGALAVALGEMSLAFSQGKKQFAAVAPQHQAIAARLNKARQMFAMLTRDDAAGYLFYQEASHTEGPDKDAKMATALAAAIDVPRQMTALALDVLADLVALAPICNAWLLSDLAAAAILAESAVRLSDLNVRVNANSLTDQSAANDLRAASARDCQRTAELRQAVEEVVRKKL